MLLHASVQGLKLISEIFDLMQQYALNIQDAYILTPYEILIQLRYTHPKLLFLTLLTP